MKRDAVMSACGQYRYSLTRTWNAGLMPTCAFVMLNPSTADAEFDDPTIRKCIGFAKRLGYGGFEVVNLFSYRATDPAELKKAGYPGQGSEDDRHILAAATRAVRTGGVVICAWGANARGLERPTHVTRLLREARLGSFLHALRHLAGGIPAHPLMLPYADTLYPLNG